MILRTLAAALLLIPLMAAAQRPAERKVKAKPKKISQPRKAVKETPEQEYQRLQEEYKLLLQQQGAPAPSPAPSAKPRKQAKPAKPRKKREEPPPAALPPEATAQIHAAEEHEQIKARPSSTLFTFELVMWQESIKLTNGGLSAKMESQFKGLMISYDRHASRPNSNWQWLYGASIGVGSMKGYGDNPIPDQFNSQPFTLGVGRVGMVYFSSPVAKIGFVIPVVVRSISWVYDDGSATKAEDVKYSAGVQALYIARLTPVMNFQASVTHQHMWETVLWAAGWGLDF